MGRAQNRTAPTATGGFDDVLGARRGARREFTALDDELAAKLAAMEAELSPELCDVEFHETLAEGMRRLERARRDGERDDQRTAALARALAGACTAVVGQDGEFAAVHWAGTFLQLNTDAGAYGPGRDAAAASLAQQLVQGVAERKASTELLDQARVELRGACAVLGARAVLRDEEQAMRDALNYRHSVLRSYDKELATQGPLTGRLSEDDWADVLMSSYKSFNAQLDNDQTPTSFLLAALDRQRACGSVTGHPRAETQRMLEAMYAEGQAARDRVRRFLHGGS